MRHRPIALAVAGALLLLALASCGSGAPLSDMTLSSPSLDIASPNEILVSYRINAPALVSIWLEDAAGARYVLRDEVRREPSEDPYQLTFDGSAALDADTRRLLPDGAYSLIVRATPAAGGAPVEQRAGLTLSNAPADPFDVHDLAAVPNPFSPDEDAVDDVTHFTYRLPVTATISLEITAPDGTRYPVLTRVERGAGEHSETWSGRPVVGGLLPAGAYQYSLAAEDGRGNSVVRRGEVEISSAGMGEMRILEVEIGPPTLELGQVLTVTYRIKNTGAIPLRTHGPPSGYEYNTNETYSSIEGEKFANKGGGLWRVGLDWEGNGGGGARYPFRWAISPREPKDWAEPFEFDYLKPGEEATIVGRLRIKQREDRMTFFVGVAHEGVDYPFDRLKQTLIKVQF